MSQPGPQQDSASEPIDPTEALLAPRKRRHRRSSSSSAAKRKASQRKRAVLAIAAIVGTALVVLLCGLAVWVWRAPALPPPMPSATVDEILAGKPVKDWRWLRLSENTAVLVLEFPSLIEQGSTMNRMAAFLEKRAGPRDRLLDNRELGELVRRSGDNAATFYFGHDYPMDKVAHFFSLAESTKQALNGQELRLRENLLRWGILKQELDGSYHSTSERALISFTTLQADDPDTTQDEAVDAMRRDSVLRHELSHGEFFTNGEYRQHSWDFWRRQLSEAERELFRKYLASIDYDARNEELMVNETQAVLMHTPDTRAFNAGDLGVTDAELERLRARFRAVK